MFSIIEEKTFSIFIAKFLNFFSEIRVRILGRRGNQRAAEPVHEEHEEVLWGCEHSASPDWTSKWQGVHWTAGRGRGWGTSAGRGVPGAAGLL